MFWYTEGVENYVATTTGESRFFALGASAGLAFSAAYTLLFSPLSQTPHSNDLAHSSENMGGIPPLLPILKPICLETDSKELQDPSQFGNPSLSGAGKPNRPLIRRQSRRQRIMHNSIQLIAPFVVVPTRIYRREKLHQNLARMDF